MARKILPAEQVATAEDDDQVGGEEQVDRLAVVQPGLGDEGREVPAYPRGRLRQLREGPAELDRRGTEGSPRDTAPVRHQRARQRVLIGDHHVGLVLRDRFLDRGKRESGERDYETFPKRLHRREAVVGLAAEQAHAGWVHRGVRAQPWPQPCLRAGPGDVVAALLEHPAHRRGRVDVPRQGQRDDEEPAHRPSPAWQART